MLKKIIFSFFILAGSVLSAAPMKQVFLSGNDAEQPKIAVEEVLKTFRKQMKIPLSKVFIKIPYNINYNIKIKNNLYYVTEYKIRIIFKTIKNSFATNEKKYIIRFLIDRDKNRVVKEEIYTITDEKYYNKDIYNLN
jgi:hypothetical protein